MDNKRKQKKIADYYFKNYSMQKGYRKRMMKIWTEFIIFNTIQRLADQARFILKKSWLSDFKMQEICGQINHEEYI